jgi:hypothetical protein
VHVAAPAWLTTSIWPPAEITPERLPPAFAATEYCRVAVPVPLAAEVIVIQLESLAASHVQSDVVVSVAVWLPPPAGTDCAVGESANEHGAGGGDAVIRWTVPPRATT